ncbi:MAG: SBBP repeat-containing protein [Sedimentisphaerales bacterium]|nr:SBBP repeat-containing protein [Sedimentisphaerales bacterium]
MTQFIPANKSRIISLVFSLCLITTTLGQSPPAIKWGRQLITPTRDGIHNGVLVTDSNDCIYIVVSRTPNDAPESASKQQHLVKLDQIGQQLWSRQLGTSEGRDTVNLVVDGLTPDEKENIYAFGYTDGRLGSEKKGGYDAFVAVYDRTGARRNVWQFGTPRHDVCTGMGIDSSGNIYVTGYTYGPFAGPNKGQADLFVAAYDRTGTLLWRDQLGTNADDRALDLCLGNNNDLYICGRTNGRLTGRGHGYGDFFVARYQRTGKSLWLQQYGTPAQDSGICIEVNELGQVYVGGITFGNFAYTGAQRGRGDAFVARISEAGNLLWKRQFGSPYWDQTWDIACFRNGSGDILVGGCQIPSKTCQGFCRRYSSEGRLIWIKEFTERSAAGGTCGRAVAVDSDNNCYHAGSTVADQFEPNNGTSNIYILRIDSTRQNPPADNNPSR